MAEILVTGGAGVAGTRTAKHLAAAGHRVRLADTAQCAAFPGATVLRCDTRSREDVDLAVSGCDAVVHLAAWHCAHVPPVSDSTIFAVNVDGTFEVLEACRRHGVKTVVYASSMAYGHGSVYSVTKVIGEDLGRCLHERTGIPVALLRYHDFVPKPYLAFGAKLLRNGVDAEDVARANVAAVERGLERAYGLFRSIVHTNHGMPPEIQADFRNRGREWCESVMPGASDLLARWAIDLPEMVEQHDLRDARDVLGWTPAVGFREFLNDLKSRTENGAPVDQLWALGSLNGVLPIPPPPR